MNDSNKSFLGAIRNEPDQRKMRRGFGGMDWTVTDEQEKWQMVTRFTDQAWSVENSEWLQDQGDLL